MKKRVISGFFMPSVVYGLWIASWIQNYFIPDPNTWDKLDAWWAFPVFFTNLIIFVSGVVGSVIAMGNFWETFQSKETLRG